VNRGKVALMALGMGAHLVIWALGAGRVDAPCFSDALEFQMG
jgi:hypothetical protein